MLPDSPTFVSFFQHMAIFFSYYLISQSWDSILCTMVKDVMLQLCKHSGQIDPDSCFIMAIYHCRSSQKCHRVVKYISVACKFTLMHPVGAPRVVGHWSSYVIGAKMHCGCKLPRVTMLVRHRKVHEIVIILALRYTGVLLWNCQQIQILQLILCQWLPLQSFIIYRKSHKPINFPVW